MIIDNDKDNVLLIIYTIIAPQLSIYYLYFLF
jgi:hypothetical protein